MLLERFPGATKSTSNRVQSDRPEADWLLQGFLQELKRRNQPAVAVDWRMIRSIAPNYEVRAQEVRDYFEDNLPGTSRTELQALGAVLGRALAVYIEPRMPVALRPLLTNVGSTSEALENSFPGYLASGMLPLLIRRY
jgi:hypothetical protein